MTLKDIQPLFKPSAEGFVRSAKRLDSIFKASFSLSTLFTFGALGQTILLVVVPPQVAVLPAIFLLLRVLIKTAIAASSPSRNTYLSGIIPGRVSAQIPDPYDGTFSSAPAERGMVVFHLGVSFNHPLGFFCPGGREVSKYNAAMMESLSQESDKYGLLGTTTYMGETRHGSPTSVSIMYFRDFEGLHRFANDPIHRAGWDHLTRLSKEGHKHISAFHETFVVRSGDYETVYLDSSPVLLGNAKIKLQEPQEGDGDWAQTLVNTDIAQLKTMSSRLQRNVVA